MVGSVSHWTPLCPGHNRGLAAGPGREVYYILPSQLRQAWLLQDQAGELEREKSQKSLQSTNLVLRSCVCLKRPRGRGTVCQIMPLSLVFMPVRQCETSLVGQPASCWCVSAWNGKRIAGSADLPEDALCHQEIARWTLPLVPDTHLHTRCISLQALFLIRTS